MTLRFLKGLTFLLAPMVAMFTSCSSCSTDDADPTPSSTLETFELQNGDLVFQTSTSNQSDPIQLATESPYSHVGMVYVDNGKAFVFEAIKTVRLTPYADWVNRGKDQHVVVKRLKDDKYLTAEHLKRMKAVGEELNGKKYDLQFQWSDTQMYCSELVWKVFARGADLQLCEPSSLTDLNWDHEEVLDLARSRYPELRGLPKNELLETLKDIQADEPMVTPADLFNCTLLEEVHREG